MYNEYTIFWNRKQKKYIKHKKICRAQTEFYNTSESG